MRPNHINDTLTEGDMGKVESPHPGRRGVGSVERLRLRWPMANRKVEVEEKTEEKMGEKMEEKMGENAKAEVKWKLRKMGEKEKMIFREEEEVAVKENIRNKKIEE